ncbi:MAG: bifunctional riboflavin kinase/FAD synthetase [Oscillospiraceae bacterium]|nr:bifunctional riboflavin kinase/FAD synthetase [Oscillospiraceae bacterium]
MEIIHSYGQLNMQKKTAVAIGYFDGMHLGHKELIRKMREYALENDLLPTILTFDMSRMRAEGKGKKDLFPREYTLNLAEEMGVKVYAEIPFSRIRDMNPDVFCREVLASENGLNVGAVFCGNNFRFGKNRSGAVANLERCGEKARFSVEVIDDIYVDGEVVSTSKIKEAIEAGDIKIANNMLGRPYSIKGEVIHGNHLAQGLGFPTANQRYPANVLVPKKGVYLTITEIYGKQYRSITNVGTRPTVTNDEEATAETHILDFNNDIYGETIQVLFYDFIRSEQRFGSRQELVDTVISNISLARKAKYPV